MEDVAAVRSVMADEPVPNPFDERGDADLDRCLPAEAAAGTNRAASAKEHMPELDGLRGLAILMVFLFHYVAVKESDVPGLGIASAAVKSLWIGVDLFFVLSGSFRSRVGTSSSAIRWN